MLIIRVIWGFALTLLAFAIIWYLLGATAMFQRYVDLVETVVLIFFGVPLLLIILSSVYLLLGGWNPSSTKDYIVLIIVMLIGMWLSAYLIINTNTQGWITEKVTKDTPQKTSDDKYEYNIELINLFQRNSHARLYLKSTSTGEEIRIPLDLPINKIGGLTMGKVNYWIHLEPISDSSKYLLRTTKKFIFPDEVFEIDIGKGVAVKLE